MKIIEDILADAQTLRDELALQIKLGTAEAKDEFEKLEPHLNKLKQKTSGIAEAAGDTARELAIAAELGICRRRKNGPEARSRRAEGRF